MNVNEQTELRALMVFDKLPDGCISFLVTDSYSEPHVRPGEYVVVDMADRNPRNGDLSVIQWNSGRRQICQTRKGDDGLWVVGSLCKPDFERWLKEERTAGRIPVYPGWSDGWFDEPHLQEKLAGAVIGIFQPDFEEPKRVVVAGSHGRLQS